jgi:hypothetical protein
MRVGFGLLLVAPVLAGLAAACSTGSDGSSSASSNDTSGISDLALAQKAATILDGDGAKCNSCHTAGEQDIQRWNQAYTAIKTECLDPALTLDPMARVNCLREDPTDATSAFTAEKLGIWAAGATGDTFKNLFQAAFPADQWEAAFKDFVTQAGMPAFNKPPLTTDEFGAVQQWFDRGLPQIDTVLTDPNIATCTPNTSPELVQHMAEMATDGWGARLAAASTPMALCGSETDPTKCLTGRPDVTAELGVEGTTQTLRELRKLTFNSSFWVRSSPDGRFASFGGSPSRIIDLTAPDTDTPISVSAPYDPGWFPNNDGFSFAGTSGGITVCRTSVVLNALATTKKINFTEPTCTPIISTVYQSVGASLDGSLFFMATGTHTNDSGDASGPLSASFGTSSATTLSPMFNDGTKYVPGHNLSVNVPNEGDQQMSASNTLLITRFGQKAGHAGYHLRQVTPHLTAAAPGTTPALPTVTVDTKIIGTACLQGGKPQLSFNERFLAVHQYTDPAAPAGNAPSSSNIFVNDLKTGKIVQVTKLKQGQRALYPHWRADGWLYFLIRDSNTGKERFIASDVALHVAD